MSEHMSEKVKKTQTGQRLAAPEDLVRCGKHTLELEAQTLQQAADLLDAEPLRPAFVSLCEAILACSGRIILMGVGKSGHIAGKIAATLSSTGTPAHFIHPSEAAHGDLGAVGEQDLVLMLSKSGSSNELEQLLPALRQIGCTLACICCEASSPLVSSCNLALVAPVEKEACPNNLAPTTSTTLMLALGDALATAILAARSFSRDEFARSHPAGRLGRRLLLTAGDLMRGRDELPMVSEDTPLTEALLVISEKKLGMAAVTGKDDRQAIGVMTDGDLRRCLERGGDISRVQVGEMMTRDFLHIAPQTMAVEALGLMQKHSISCLMLVEDGALVGVVTLHDIIRANID